MGDGLCRRSVCIGGNGTGNQLVLKRDGEALRPQMHIWDHETNKTRAWNRDVSFLVAAARRRVSEIQKQIDKSKMKTEPTCAAHGARRRG
jgi:hypothetical protein